MVDLPTTRPSTLIVWALARLPMQAASTTARARMAISTSLPIKECGWDEKEASGGSARRRLLLYVAYWNSSAWVPESPDTSAKAGGSGGSGWAVGPAMASPATRCGIHATSRAGLPVGPGFYGGLHAFGAIEQSSFQALPWRMRSRAAHRPDSRRTDSPCWAKIGIGSGFPRDGRMLGHANHGHCLRIL